MQPENYPKDCAEAAQSVELHNAAGDTTKSSLEISDAQSAAVQKTPNRIDLTTLENSISSIEFITPQSLPHLTIAVVRLINGYSVIGQSAPADPENFNAELGQKFAAEDAKRKIWPLLGFSLCEKMTKERLGLTAVETLMPGIKETQEAA